MTDNVNSATLDTATTTGTSTNSAAPVFTCSSRYGYAGITSGCKCAELPTPTTRLTTTTTVTVSSVTTVKASLASRYV